MRSLREYLEMVKRFLVVGDNHMDSKTPASRLDNYMEATLMELRETLRIAKAGKCDYYILLGDVFNRIEVGGECRNRALEILASDDGDPWPFEKYVVVGNHDIAHDPDKLEKSALQTLISAGVVKYSDTIDSLPVRFFHFRPFLDKDLNEGCLTRYDDKIMFLHASIVDKPLMFDHVLFSDLKIHDDTRLLFSGHIHRKMESVNKNGVRFINPGSLGRPEISSDYEKGRVSVIMLQYDFSSDEYQTKTFDLKYSAPYDVIFDLDRSKQKRTENKNTELFIEAITNTSVNDNISSNISDDLITFAKSRNVEKEVMEMAKKTIETIKTGGEL